VTAEFEAWSVVQVTVAEVAVTPLTTTLEITGAAGAPLWPPVVVKLKTVDSPVLPLAEVDIARK
jgi:hypothetical protein